MPAAGATAARWRGLAELARRDDVGLARLVEAHLDATAILTEFGVEPRPGLYGVWASAGDVVLRSGRVNGRKPFCSGAGVCDRALVTCVDQRGKQVLVDMEVGNAELIEPSWSGSALGSTSTMTVGFRASAADRVVGGHRWYLDRAGFWHGAIGPAACWGGAALGLVDALDSVETDDPHRLAARGGARADAWAIDSLLSKAGDDADARPADQVSAHRRALAARHGIASASRRVLQRVDAFGPRLWQLPPVRQRMDDLRLYLLQSHGEADLAILGGPTVDGR